MLKKNLKTDAHTHPALVAERQKIMDERRAKLLALKPTFQNLHKVEFGDIRPMHRPYWVPPKFTPARAEALDHLAHKSRGPI